MRLLFFSLSYTQWVQCIIFPFFPLLSHSLQQNDWHSRHTNAILLHMSHSGASQWSHLYLTLNAFSACLQNGQIPSQCLVGVGVRVDTLMLLLFYQRPNQIQIEWYCSIG